MADFCSKACYTPTARRGIGGLLLHSLARSPRTLPACASSGDWNRRTVVTDDMPGKAGSGALRTDAMPKARELVLRKKEMPSAGRPEQRLRSRPYPVTRQDFRHFQSRATPDSSCMSIRREQVRPGSDAQRTPEARGPAQSGGAPLPGPGRERLSGNL